VFPIRGGSVLRSRILGHLTPYVKCVRFRKYGMCIIWSIRSIQIVFVSDVSVRRIWKTITTVLSSENVHSRMPLSAAAVGLVVVGGLQGGEILI